MKEIALQDFQGYIKTVKKEEFRLKFFPRKDRSVQSMPVAVIGKGGGPVIIVVSAMHGDEINGVYSNHLLYNSLNGDEVRGKIILFPIANPQAFNEGKRISSVDYIDMNRTFAFFKKRKPTEHLASLLFERIFEKANYIFDLHTGGSGEYIPLVVTVSEGAFLDAAYLNLGNIIQASIKGGSLLPNCEKKGIRAFCVEMGKALKLNREYCKDFVKGFRNFLVFKGMMDGELEIESAQRIFQRKMFVPAKKSGFFEPFISLGEEVEKGQLIGEIETLFSTERLKVVSPENGVVLYLRYEDSVTFGDSLIHLGIMAQKK